MSAKKDRANELLADRALEGLGAAEIEELAELLEGAEDVSFELAAAAVSLATSRVEEQLPPHLAAKIAAAALPAPRSSPRPAPTAQAKGEPRRSDPWRYAGWLAAAACLALALAGWLTRRADPAPIVMAPSTTSASSPPSAPARVEPPKPPVPPTPAEELAKLLARAPDALRIAWAATKDPGARGAGGEVVWSDAEQRGFMRFRGLAANDPAKSQYQLWIFDPAQDAKTPVDGGVFDVDAATGDVIVPITAKLRVSRPTLFAVTVEKPGGVVVSKREHLVLLAAVSPG